MRYLSLIAVLTTTNDQIDAPYGGQRTIPWILAIIHRRHNSPFDCTTFVWKYLMCKVMSCAYFEPRHSLYWYSSSRYNFKVFTYDAVLAVHQVPGLPRPIIEPMITFPCRADALRVMPRTWVFKHILINHWSYPLRSNEQFLIVEMLRSLICAIYSWLADMP